MATAKKKKLKVEKSDPVLVQEPVIETVDQPVTKRKKLTLTKSKQSTLEPVLASNDVQASVAEPQVEPVAAPVVSAPTQPDKLDPVNTYSVEITSLATANIAGLTGVVVTVSWVVTGSDGVNTVTYPGSINVGGPDPNDFIQYPDLTPDEVLSWIPNQLYPGMIATIDQALAAMSNPPVPTTPPWA